MVWHDSWYAILFGRDIVPVISKIHISRNTKQAGRLNCYVKIKGKTLKIGIIQPKTKVNLYDRCGVMLQSVDSNNIGEYAFDGVGRGESYTIISFDSRKQFNAVIQDNVVPK